MQSVSQLGLGTLPLSGAYGSVGEGVAQRVVSRAIDLGATLIDTADAYGEGLAEQLIGRAIVGRHHEVEVATKVGLVDGGRGGVRNDRVYLRAAVAASKARLGVERIDLLFLHRIDRKIPIEETVGILGEFVQEGIVARIGLSEVTSIELQRALAVHPIAAVQSEWSVWSRDVERRIVPMCARTDVIFVSSSPLGRGFLSGRTTAPLNGDRRSGVPRLSNDHRSLNIPIAHELARLAKRERMSPAQVALVWLRETGRRAGVDLLPIPGARSVAHVEENLASLDCTMTIETLEALDGVAHKASGNRGNPDWLSFGHE
ncbi:aryl-alcohol dehydrogenase-like predicted oxidoreductase [Rathayibacter sp. PhB151]|uniref:aldo/keto reductase n=1 Tax=Rathayibacter sp. PhB151 TaxID=2485189 RepID=UPI0010644130|nr:aldo/keto reductase [Rathayibacter sp. PhB151]TDX79068.1 aryl-alcohol dehydrogenase-like predicted oxidoreductase [Rathayibacter sp. PhB151]